MAAPVVTGAIALMLEKDPQLAPQTIRQNLADSARHHAFTGKSWSPEFGWGKLDLCATLSML